MQSWRGASSLDGLCPADYRRHRVADVLHPFGQTMGLDPLEPGVTQIELDEVRVAPAIEPPPDGDRLGPKAPVREADDERSARPQHPRDLAEHSHRLLQ